MRRPGLLDAAWLLGLGGFLCGAFWPIAYATAGVAPPGVHIVGWLSAMAAIAVAARIALPIPMRASSVEITDGSVKALLFRRHIQYALPDLTRIRAFTLSGAVVLLYVTFREDQKLILTRVYPFTEFPETFLEVLNEVPATVVVSDRARFYLGYAVPVRRRLALAAQTAIQTTIMFCAVFALWSLYNS